MLKTQQSNDLRFIIESLAELRTEIKAISKSIDDIKSKVDFVDKEATLIRIAVGKLEIKNAMLAGLAGTVTGFFGSKVGGG